MNWIRDKDGINTKDSLQKVYYPDEGMAVWLKLNQ